MRVLMDSLAHTTVDNMFSSDNKTTKSKAIWVPIVRVDRVISRGNKYNMTIDDRVIERKKNIPGTIKYVGPTHFDKVSGDMVVHRECALYTILVAALQRVCSFKITPNIKWTMF